MLFTTLPFFVFLTVVVAGYYLLPGRLRNVFLLAASYFFYLYPLVLDPALSREGRRPLLVVFLLAATLIIYGAARALPACKTPRGKKLLLLGAILLVLGALFYFKYTNFLLSTLQALLRSGVGFAPLAIVAPLGISFYTFQSVGYLIDVYRGDIPPERNLIDYALFVSFFAHILSGPIARAPQLLPQFKQAHPLRYQNVLFGGQRLLWGLFKKAVIADWLGTFVDYFFNEDILLRSGLPLLAGAVLYMLQLYFDFSGYSDMALGAAKMLGFTLMENFRTPFYATNLSGFWSRWHISLTGWFRDYLYIPLGGNRKGYARKLLNILLVFLVSGLWHGAGYGFLFWGLLFGLFRVAEELLHRFVKPRTLANRYLQGGWNTLKRIGVFCIVSFCFIFFRVEDLAGALHIVKTMFSSFDILELWRTVCSVTLSDTASSSMSFAYYILAVVGASFLLVLLADWFIIYKAPPERDNAANVLQHLPALPRWLCYIFIIAAILTVGVFGKSSFTYFVF